MLFGSTVVCSIQWSLDGLIDLGTGREGFRGFWGLQSLGFGDFDFFWRYVRMFENLRFSGFRDLWDVSKFMRFRWDLWILDMWGFRRLQGFGEFQGLMIPGMGDF